MIPFTTSRTYAHTYIVEPLPVNAASLSSDPTSDNDSPTIGLPAKVIQDSQAGQFKKRRSSVMTAPNQWHSNSAEMDSPVSSEIDETENDAESDSDCDYAVETRYIDPLKNALNVFHGMTGEKMTWALAGNDEMVETFFDDIRCLLTSRENSDVVRNAKQLIIDYAKTQSADFRFRIFNAGNGLICVPWLDLSGMNFEGINLRGANFSNSNLSEANFSGIDLRGANFNDANLNNAVFNGANLAWSHFERANLFGAKLNVLSVDGAKFCKADLRNINLTGSNLQGAIFTKANMENTIFKGANLNDTSFAGANLKKADFSGVNLRRVNLSRTTLIGAVFTGTNFDGANLSGADLRSINFNGLALHGANFSHTNLCHANFKGMNLSGVILEDADLSYADLSGTNLENMIFGKANFNRANLRLANLNCANFGSSALYGADLRGANVPLVIFSTRCGVDSNLFVVAERNNDAFMVSSWRNASVKTRNHNGLNVFEDPYLPVQSRSARSNQARAVTFNPVRSIILPVAQRQLPAPPPSFWSWITCISMNIGQFFRSVFRRLWGAS